MVYTFNAFPGWFHFGRFFSSYFLLALLSYTHPVSGQPAPLSFTDCSSGVNLSPSLRINISDVYGQIITDSDGDGDLLKIVAFGDTGRMIEPFSNVTNLLSEAHLSYFCVAS